MSRATMLVAQALRRTPRIRDVLAERDALREQVARQRVELARRQVRPGLGYVFVVTYGRSGSTLLQGILNAIPGWLIRGENGGAVYHLYRHFTAVMERKRPRSGPGKPTLESTSPWFGIDRYPARLAVEELRTLVVTTLLRPQRDTRVTGFKEIRWQQKDLVGYLLFLQRLFPEARFVFNTRDHESVAASKWWQRAQDPLAEIARVEALHREAFERLGDAAYLVHYDDYVADPSVLRGLFDWLGEEWDEARVRAVMSVRHSY